MDKTNVMRILEQKKIPYRDYQYDHTRQNIWEVAPALGIDPSAIFKTLVTAGKSKKYYVFMIPVQAVLDLKKAALAAHEKSIDMIPQRDLFPLTGYVHGGCSPIGMKKQFPTFIHRTAEALESICFSAGRPGRQVRMSLADLQWVIPVVPADLTK